MITQLDLEQAIGDCLSNRNPDVNTCLKLASFYVIKDHLFPERKAEQSFAPPAVSESFVDYPGESEFMQAVDGKPSNEVWAVVDELMETLSIINPRLYEAVLRRLM